MSEGLYNCTFRHLAVNMSVSMLHRSCVVMNTGVPRVQYTCP